MLWVLVDLLLVRSNPNIIRRNNSGDKYNNKQQIQENRTEQLIEVLMSSVDQMGNFMQVKCKAERILWTKRVVGL